MQTSPNPIEAKKYEPNVVILLFILPILFICRDKEPISPTDDRSVLLQGIRGPNDGSFDLQLQFRLPWAVGIESDRLLHGTSCFGKFDREN